MKIPKPASLSSSLLARQGEARPAAPSESECERAARTQQEEIETSLPAEISGEKEESATVAPSDATVLEGEAGEEEENAMVTPGDATAYEGEPEEEGVTLAEWARRSSRGVGDDSDLPMSKRPAPGTGGEGTFRARGVLFVIVAVVLGSVLGLWLGTGANRSELPKPPPPVIAPEATRAAPIARDAANRDVAVAPLAPAAPRPPQSTEPPPRAGAGTPASETTLSGAFAVQLVAARSRAAAENEWTKLTQKHAELLRAVPHEIARAEIEGRGTFYRLRVGNFDSLGGARDLCGALKAQGQDCVAVKR